MSMDTGGPVFPIFNSEGFVSGYEATQGYGSGMTLRDYFAAHAPEVPLWFYNIDGKQIADQHSYALWAYSYADEMIKQRQK